MLPIIGAMKTSSNGFFCSFLYFLCLLIQIGVSFGASSGTYTIVAPKKLRPNSDYHIALSVYNVDTPVNIEVEMSGLDQQTQKFTKVQQTVTLQSTETRIVNFEIGGWGAGNYQLAATGTGGLNFKNFSKVDYDGKSFSVFIQTDKAIYKPGQKVLFRAIIVRPSLTIPEIGASTVYILDAKNNRIKQWDRVFTNHGVLSFDLKLSDNPVLGEWTIVVEIERHTYRKSFTVAEYVLPTFNVEVNLPPYTTYKNSDVVANVKATYTYGKPVTGEVTLTVQVRSRYHTVTYRPLDQFQVKAKLNGSINIPVNIVQSLNLKNDPYDREIEFFALVEEALTGRSYNKTAILKFYETEINVEMVESYRFFKPGLKTVLYFKVAHRDGSPVEDNGPKLRLAYGYGWDSDLYRDVIEKVPEKGLVRVEIKPENTTRHLGMRAEYMGQKYEFNGLESALTSSGHFIQLNLPPGQDIRVGSKAVLEVSTTEPVEKIVSLVLSKGDIVAAKNFNFRSNDLSIQTIEIPITYSMAPTARVVVYYVRSSNQEVIADSLSLDVEGVFRTPVSIEVSNKLAKPDEKIDIQVKTNPNAFAAILGLDQSVLLLKGGNDITKPQVINELATYDYNDVTNDVIYRKRRSLLRRFRGYSAKSSADIFSKDGMIIFSNGLVYSFNPSLFYRSQPVEFSASAMMSPDTFDGHNPKLVAESSVKVRSRFPETWLWNNSIADSTGNAKFTSHIPHTITSWIISAFAVDHLTGLGVVDAPTKVTVFRPFFIKLNIPYSVIRGETLSVQVLVFNYMKKAKDAQVTLYNPDNQFSFTVASNEINEQLSDPSRNKFVTIQPESAASVSFLITPKKVGFITLKVTARTDNAGDAVIKMLPVKPEGQTQYFNKALLLDFRLETGKSNHIVPIHFPTNAIQGSKAVTISIIGDVLGTSLSNLDDLLRMPYGCGEQNMLNFVPNIIVLKYLRQAKRLTDDVADKAISHMEVGYQRELTYKRSDGSFSAFGERDKHGSTWLTAFVLKSLHQAKSNITIDPIVLESATKFLLSKQVSDGSFIESGEIHFKPMQGGSTGNMGTLTAYVLIALLQDQNLALEYSEHFRKSEAYLMDQLRQSDSSYATAIITYALHLMNSPAADSASEKLLNVMKHDRDFSWFSDEPQVLANITNKQSSHFFLPKSTDIEATAYGMLTLVFRNEITTALPLMKWLISRQNSQGGFSSTQDTVIALQALAELASLVSSSTISLEANFKFPNTNEKPRVFSVKSINSQVLQTYEMTDVDSGTLPTSVEVEVSGFGVAVAQVSWRYNLAVSGEEPAFYLNPQMGKTSNENFLQLNLCTYYKAGNATNMAVMEIDLPSGYTVDTEALSSIKSQASGVKRVESTKGDTNVVIYFDRITRDELCLTVPAHRTQDVANNKPVPVSLYDYYNRQESARIFYEPVAKNVCNICEGLDCNCVGKTPTKVTSDYTGSSTGGTSSAKLSKISIMMPLLLQIVCLYICIK